MRRQRWSWLKRFVLLTFVLWLLLSLLLSLDVWDAEDIHQIKAWMNHHSILLLILRCLMYVGLLIVLWKYLNRKRMRWTTVRVVLGILMFEVFLVYRWPQQWLSIN